MLTMPMNAKVAVNTVTSSTFILNCLGSLMRPQRPLITVAK
jgi:hypothetical protein